MKKVIILFTSSVIIICASAFLILTKSSILDRRTESPFDVNPQALSTGLIGIDEKTVPEAGGKEAALYIESCAFCHDLPDPSSHDAMEWVFVIERMEILFDEVKGQKGVVIPWAVGSDCGCGMGAVRSSIHKSEIEDEGIRKKLLHSFSYEQNICHSEQFHSLVKFHLAKQYYSPNQ